MPEFKYFVPAQLLQSYCFLGLETYTSLGHLFFFVELSSFFNGLAATPRDSVNELHEVFCGGKYFSDPKLASHMLGLVFEKAKWLMSASTIYLLKPKMSRCEKVARVSNLPENSHQTKIWIVFFGLGGDLVQREKLVRLPIVFHSFLKKFFEVWIFSIFGLEFCLCFFLWIYSFFSPCQTTERPLFLDDFRQVFTQASCCRCFTCFYGFQVTRIIFSSQKIFLRLFESVGSLIFNSHECLKFFSKV